MHTKRMIKRRTRARARAFALLPMAMKQDGRRTFLATVNRPTSYLEHTSIFKCLLLFFHLLLLLSFDTVFSGQVASPDSRNIFAAFVSDPHSQQVE